MIHTNHRLRKLQEYIDHLLPDARVEVRRSPMTNDYEIRIRISDMAIVAPTPVGQIERDRERLLQVQE